VKLITAESALAVFGQERQIGLTGTVQDGNEPQSVALALGIQGQRIRL
jgi:hypothetical protein